MMQEIRQIYLLQATTQNYIFEQSIAYNSLLIYNKLPSEIKSVQSIRKFKKLLSSFLLEKFLFSERIYNG
jgi:hypothetical protein